MTKDELGSLNQPPSIEELVISNLRKAIVTAQLKPGESLDQEELARQLGVSRTPVRYALRALASEHLVTFYPRRGAVVAELAVKEIREIFFIRMLLEGAAARIAAEQTSPQIAKRLEALHEEMCATTENPSNWLLLDREFHTTLYDASDHPRLNQVIKSLRDDVERYVRAYIDTDDNIPRSNIKHGLILNTYSTGDASACEQHTLEHLEEVFQIFKSNLENNQAE